MVQAKPMRHCVVAVVEGEQGLYLVGERSNHPGSWQFPQGGVEDGENLETALLRELGEEVGCNQLTILKQGQFSVSYDFPLDLNSTITKFYKGQTQQWFLLKFKPQAKPDLDQSDGEFRALHWLSLEDILVGIVDWKKKAYEEGLRSLGILPIA